MEKEDDTRENAEHMHIAKVTIYAFLFIFICMCTIAYAVGGQKTLAIVHCYLTADVAVWV